MSAVDIALLALGGFFVIRGMIRGLSGEFFSLLGIAGGFYCSMTYCAPLSAATSAKWNVNPLITTAIAIVVIFSVVLLFCAITGKLVKKFLKATRLSRLDALLGSTAGLFKTLLCILAVLIIAIIVSPVTGNGWVRKSKVLMTTAQALPFIYPPLEKRGLVPNIEKIRVEAVEFLLNRSLNALTERGSSDDILTKTTGEQLPEEELINGGETGQAQTEKNMPGIVLPLHSSEDQTPEALPSRRGLLEYFFAPDVGIKFNDKSDDR